MRSKAHPAFPSRLLWCSVSALLILATWSATPAWAQSAPPSGVVLADPSLAEETSPSGENIAGPVGEIVTASCASCGSGGIGLGHAHGGGLLGGCCSTCGSECVPGRFHTCFCTSDHMVGRMLCCLYECLCCPDPCYEPCWIAAANSAMFADSPRPVSHMRLRWDSGYNFEFPDRAEYFWARADGDGKGPSPIIPGRSRLRYMEFTYYTEAAAGPFGAFVEIPYRRVENEVYKHESGFADMNVGTKSVLIDCELLLLTFQFKTYIPIGQAAKGLGTDHVSLEPSLLWALQLAPDVYFQGQAAYFIPIAGDDIYAGDIFHYHLSLNFTFWRPIPDVQLIASAELNGWSVLDGAYTDPVDPAVIQRARDHLLSAGPGMRLVICDKLDFGFGAAFGITENNFAKDLYRAELRWRF